MAETTNPTATTPTAPARRSLPRRVLRGVWRVTRALLLTVLLLVLLVVGVLAFVTRTGSGRELLRSQIEKRTASALPRLEVRLQEIPRLGLDGIHLRGLRVRGRASEDARAPWVELVRFERFEVKLQPGQLLKSFREQKILPVESIELTGLHAAARILPGKPFEVCAHLPGRQRPTACVDPTALFPPSRPEPPKPPQPDTGPPDLGVRLGRLHLDGSVTLEMDAAKPPLAVEKLALDVKAELKKGLVVVADVTLGLDAVKLKVDATADLVKPKMPLKADLVLDAPQEDLARLVGFLGLATQSGIHLTTHAEGNLDDIKAKVGLDLVGPWPGRQKRGRLAIDAQVRPSPLKADAVLKLERIDPAEILAGLPAAQANLELKARAEGDWPTMKADADLTLGALRFQDVVVESGRIRAGLDNGKVDLKELVIKLPTGTVDLHGKAGVDPKKVPFDLALKVGLARLEEVPRAPKGVGGSLDLDAHLTGTLEQPHARLSLKGRGLRYPGVSVGSLDLKVDGAGPIDAPRADVHLRAAGLVVPGRKAQSVALDVRLRPAGKGLHHATVSLDYRESARAVVKLDLAATLDQVKQSGQIANLDLQLAGYRLRTARSAGLAVIRSDADAGIQVDHLELQRQPVAGYTAPRERDSLAISGKFGPGAQAVGKVKIGALDLPELVATAKSFLPGLKLPKVAGRLDLDVDVDRRLGGPRTLSADVKLGLKGVAVDQRKLAQLDVGVKLRPRQLGLDVSTSSELGLAIKGTLPLDAESLTRGKVNLVSAPLDLEVSLPPFAFSQLRHLDPSLESVAKLPGAVQLKVKLGGRWPKPEVTVDVDADQLEAAGLNRLGALVRTRVDGNGVNVGLQAQHEGRTLVDANVGLKLDGSNLLRDLVLGKKVDFQGLVKRTPFAVKVAVTGVTAADLPPGIFAPPDDLGLLQANLRSRKVAVPPLRLGQLDASLEATGTIDAPRAGLALRVRDIGVQQADLNLKDIDTLINVRVNGPARKVTVEGHVDWQSKRLVDILAVLDGPDQLPLEKSLADRRAQIDANIRIKDLELQRFAGAIPSLKRLVGKANLHLQAKGDVGRPEVRADLKFLGLRPKVGVTPVVRKDRKGKPVYASIPHPELDLTGEVRLDNRSVKVQLAGHQRSQDGPGKLTVQALVDGFDLDRAKGKMDGMRVKATVDIGALDISIARAVVQVLGETGGRLFSRIEVEGTPASPAVRGHIRLEDGTVALIPLQQTFRQINLAADVSNSGFKLRRMKLNGGDGTAEITGNVDMLDLKPHRMGFDIELKKFPAAASADAAAVIDTQIRFDGKLAPSSFDGEVKFLRALVRVPEQKSKDLQSVDPLEKVTLQREDQVRLWERKKKAPKAKVAKAGEKPAAPFRTTIKVALGKVKDRGIFRIQTKELIADLRANITANVGDGKVSVEGKAEVISGRLRTLGKDFKIETAVVTFPGGDPSNPFLDVAAIHQLKEHLVRVRIRGSAKKPELTMESEPDVGDQRAVLALLLTGTTSFDSAGAQAAALSAVSGFAANAIKEASGVPIDSLKLDLGPDGSKRAEAGTYLTDTIYVAYSNRLGTAKVGENENEAILEWRFKPRWTLETRYGDANAGGVDLTWTFKH